MHTDNASLVHCIQAAGTTTESETPACSLPAGDPCLCGASTCRPNQAPRNHTYSKQLPLARNTCPAAAEGGNKCKELQRTCMTKLAHKQLHAAQLQANRTSPAQPPAAAAAHPADWHGPSLSTACLHSLARPVAVGHLWRGRDCGQHSRSGVFFRSCRV
jgi:hypothetical protein